jgi:hypothetical protein
MRFAASKRIARQNDSELGVLEQNTPHPQGFTLESELEERGASLWFALVLVHWS